MDGGQMDKPKRDYVPCRGMKFPKDSNIIRGKIRGSLRDEGYEGKEATAALKVVREGDIVMELGGGIGFMSTLVATKRKIQHVHTFEANPNLVPYIKRVHEANNVTNATVHNALLGARKGKAKFYVRGNFLASSLDEKDGQGVTSVEEIEVRNAKSEIKALKPTVLICDIEGAEVDVIPQLDLTGLRAAIIELHPQWIGPEGVNAVFNAFIKAGLSYYARGSVNKVVSFRRSWPLR